MKPRVLMTGATGLIGRAIVERVKDTVDLIALGRSEPPPGVQWLRADLKEPVSLSILPPSVDAVIHLAQSEHFRDFPNRSREVFQVNVATVEAMLDWARRAGARRFILASSGGVYGHGNDAFSEADVIRPSGPLSYYLASKRCAELLTESYANLFTVVILRFFFVYGPGQKPSMLIPRLIDTVKAGRTVYLEGTDGIRLNPTYVSDAALAACRALSLTSSDIINVAGGEVFSLRELVQVIGSAVGRKPSFEVRQQSGPRHLVGSIDKMSRLLGPPATKFSDGLKTMLEHSAR